MNNKIDLNFENSAHYTFKLYNDKESLVFEKTITSVKDFMDVIPQLKFFQQVASLSPTEVDSLLNALTKSSSQP